MRDINACEQDLIKRKEMRLKYPGACSIEYQNAISIFIECLLRWDKNKQKAKGEGILGTVVAFAPAHEEQGRHTLHSHWQVWIKEVSNEKRQGLWHEDPNIRKKNREEFYKYVDRVMKASYTTPLSFQHNCNGRLNENKYDIYERDHQCFRDARHQALSILTRGHLLQCVKCKNTFTPTFFVENTLSEKLRSYGIDTTLTPQPVGSTEERKLSCMTDAQLDVAAYSYMYDFHSENGQLPVHIANTQWADDEFRSLLREHRFEYHDMWHRYTCFKKGCECRFMFPFLARKSTVIDEEEDEFDINAIQWNRLSDPKTVWLSPWLLTPQRELGSEYVNTYNYALSEIFNCNTNVQIGDIWQIYYSTLYGSKSTQQEDSDRVQRILYAVSRRLQKLEEDIHLGRKLFMTPEDSFTSGLSVVLSGLRAATSRHVVSATMAHLIVSLDGTRFEFSHKFGHLLISQLEATLNGENTDFRIRTMTINKQQHIYHDSTSEDYIFRPRHLEDKCAYYMTMWYKKTTKSAKQIKQSLDNPNNQSQSDSELNFLEGHSGRHFTKLRKLPSSVIPIMFYDNERLADLRLLDLTSNLVYEETQRIREEYAKIALLMFYPFRTVEDIKLQGSHWKLFQRELESYNNGENTVMWKEGFEILQNIEDRKMMQQNVEKRKDEITRSTKNRLNLHKIKINRKKKKTKPLDDDE